TVFEIRQELAEIMKVRHSTHVENGRLIRKLREDSDLGHDLTAELWDLDFALRAETADRLNDPGIHVARGHAFFDGGQLWLGYFGFAFESGVSRAKPSAAGAFGPLPVIVL